MQLRHLATFLAIAEHGTLTAAAEHLYKTQGAVSYDLKTLERELGVLLFDRSGQRVALTRAGAALLPHARELVLRVLDAEGVMRRFKSGEEGVIRVGVLPSLSSLLAKRVASYIRTKPQASFLVLSELRRVLVDWLEAGKLDLAIADPALDTNLSPVNLGTESLVIVVPKNHPLATAAALTPADVADYSFVSFTRELGSTLTAERFFSSLGRYPEPVLEVNDFRLMKQFIRQGLGFGLLPSSTLEADDHDLVSIPTLPPSERQIAILRSATPFLSPAAKDFESYLSQSWRMVDANAGAQPLVANDLLGA